MALQVLASSVFLYPKNLIYNSIQQPQLIQASSGDVFSQNSWKCGSKCLDKEAPKATGNFGKFQPSHLPGSAATEGLRKQTCQCVHMCVHKYISNIQMVVHCKCK